MPTVEIYNDIMVEVSINPGNIRPAVSSFSMHLEENTIPTVTLEIDPHHTTHDSPDVTLPTIGDVKTWLDDLQKIAATKDSRCRIQVEVREWGNTEAQGLEQRLDLQDWILTSAGMGSVGGAGNVMIELVFQHPASKVDWAPAGYSLFSATTLYRNTQLYGDIVDGFSQFYRSELTRLQAASSNTIMSGEPVPRPAAELTTWLRTALEALSSNITKHLKWDTQLPGNSVNYSGFPLIDSCLARHAANVKEYYALTLQHNIATSPWALLVGGLVQDYHLAVIPRFWTEALQVLPASPWAAPSMLLYTREISEIAMPGNDLADIGGVILDDIATPMALAYTTANKARGETDPTLAPDMTYVAYIPDQSLTKSIPGHIPRLAPPSWLSAVTMSFNTALGAYATAGNTRDEESLPFAEALTDYAGDYRSALVAIAQQLFMSQYRNTMEAVITMPLRLRAMGSMWHNNYVIPGCVTRILADATGDSTTTFGTHKALLDMYAVKVVHKISVEPPRAYTMVYGRYCRPEGGIPGVVSTPAYNSMYTKGVK